MQVRCPHCSTAYEIPPPVRPRRLRCAECGNEWRELPPTEAGPIDPPAPAVESVVAPIVPPPAPIPALADALHATPPTNPPVRRATTGLALWLVLWALSLLLIGGAAFASWHFRGTIEHRWPESLWLFRLLPAGVPL